MEKKENLFAVSDKLIFNCSIDRGGSLIKQEHRIRPLQQGVVTTICPVIPSATAVKIFALNLALDRLILP